MFRPICLWALCFALLLACRCDASTTITNTRAEVTYMSSLWETDTLTISGLADAQYPQYSGYWDYLFPHTSISADGDIHTDMALDVTGTGKAGNNTGASPIICEVINAVSAQLNHLDGLTGRQATFRGIFRLYTEHASERHFELHPVTELDLGSAIGFAKDADYHTNIATVPDGATHATSTLTYLLNGSQMVTAVVAADNQNNALIGDRPNILFWMRFLMVPIYGATA